MPQDRIRIGIVGLRPGQSWAWLAHLPALRALPDDYSIVGVANGSHASAVAAAAATDIPHAFESVEALVTSPNIDMVAVTVKVPHHHAIVAAAIAAGKHVYCEWPLGNGLAEAEVLAALARAKGVIGAIGTQACVAPEIAFVQDLIAQGYVGDVLSTTLIGSGMNWGATIEQSNAYTLDQANGANMLTIPFGHTMAAVTQTLGHVAALSATVMTRRDWVQIVDTGEAAAMTAPDQVLVSAVLDGGAPASIHYRGGMPKGTGLLWEINGTQGDLQVTGIGGHAQFVEMAVAGAHGDDPAPVPLPIPERFYEGPQVEGFGRNVARIYQRLAADIRNGTRTAPDFDDAVRLHRLIDAVERSSDTGRRIVLTPS